MYSGFVLSRLRCVRNTTNCAIIHSVALCPRAGYSLNWGRNTHVSGIHRWSILKILAMHAFIHAHCSGVSPHSSSRWDRVSRSSHCLQVSVWTMPMVWNRWLVGMMSCRNLYHIALVAIGIGASQRFSQIVPHSIYGSIFSIRFIGGSDLACNRVKSVPYIFL
jgi:hypothetical protein